MVCMLAMLAVVVLGVAFRAANNAISWTDELAQYLLVWVGFLGWIIASRRRSHIRIGVLIDRLPSAARVAAELLIQVLVIALAVILLWQAQGLIARNIDVYAVTLPFPSAMLYALLPVLGVALILQAVADMVDAVRRPDRLKSASGALLE